MKQANICSSPEPQVSDAMVPIAAIAERLAHMIRSPLSVIMSAADQLDQKYQSLPDENDFSYARAILSAAEKIEDILKRFIQYAYPPQPEMQPVDLNELCRMEADKLDMPMLFIPDDNISEIYCDPFQIRLVLADLIENARQATGPEGEIILKTGLEDHRVTITIENNGRRLAREMTEKAFVPFFSTRPGQSGLGLAIARRLIEAHRGNVELKRIASGGTRAVICLPHDSDKNDEGV